MNRTREPAFRRAQEHVFEGASIAIVGPLSRTWHSDQSTLLELFDWINSCGARAWVLAKRPFQITAQAAHYVQHSPGLTIFDEDSVEAEMIINEKHASLCIVLASRVHDELEQASPHVASAKAHGLPILVLFHTGAAAYLENHGD